MRRLVGVWVVALVGVGVCYLVWGRKIDVHAEGGPLEVAQLVAWCGVLVVVGVAMWRARCGRDRWSAGWMGVVGLLATMRELDLHEALSAGVSWLPPVHFRLDWVTDPGTPLWAKVFWGVVGAVVLAALVVPVLVVKAPGGRLLRAGDGPTWLVHIAVAVLALGYVMDDVLGRGRFGVHYEVTQGLEEVCELLGVMAFGLAAVEEARAPISVRLRRLEKGAVVASEAEPAAVR